MEKGIANRADENSQKKSAQAITNKHPRYGNRGKPDSLSGRFRCGHGQLCGQGMEKQSTSCPHPVHRVAHTHNGRPLNSSRFTTVPTALLPAKPQHDS